MNRQRNISAGWARCSFDLKDPEYWIPVHNSTTSRMWTNNNRLWRTWSLFTKNALLDTSLSQFLSHCKILLAAVAKWNMNFFFGFLGISWLCIPSIFQDNSLGRNIWNCIEFHEKQPPCKNHMFTNFQKYLAVKFCGKQIIVTSHSASLLTTLGADSRQDLQMIFFLQWHDLSPFKPIAAPILRAQSVWQNFMQVALGRNTAGLRPDSCMTVIILALISFVSLRSSCLESAEVVVCSDWPSS